MMLIQPELHELDPAILGDTLDVPEAFKASVFTPAQLMDRLGVDDVSTFWLAVRDGLIPRGVFLPTTEPLCVWSRELIEEWIKCGCPPDLIHRAHAAIINNNLVQAVRDTLSPRPPTQSEIN